MRLAIGLVVKGGKEFINKYIKSIERIKEMVLVIDNGADPIVRKKLLNHPQVKQYHIQRDMTRNMSRDYQKILEMDREENVTWLWMLDIDEVVSEIEMNPLIFYLANTKDVSVGMPFFEMRNDDKHYIMISIAGYSDSHARTCHKLFKVLSHFEFNIKDYHGCPIPQNCAPGAIINIPVQHYGHLTKKLRQQKQNCYTEDIEDKSELQGTWMMDDDKVKIKKWRNRPNKQRK